MLKVYGLNVSYFTGKLETYLRYKEIPYELCPMTAKEFTRTIPEKTGALQMPAVELPDGRWITDTSPIIDWLETEHTSHLILPDDPVQAFVCRLIEDYADEWLWRPAMHYRWSYPASSKLLARQISDVVAREMTAPSWLVRWRTNKRQKYNFVERDGVTDETRPHVEGCYLKLLKILEEIFAKRPYIFGDKPSLADIGLSGPMLRHFSMDPTPAEIMRETSPSVMEWVYRLWNCRMSRVQGGYVDDIPDDLYPLIREIGETHLEALNANAVAWNGDKKRHDANVQNVQYRDLQTSQYRVWCLEILRERYAALSDVSRDAVKSLLEKQGALEALLRLENIKSGYDEEKTAPFAQAIPVFKEISS